MVLPNPSDVKCATAVLHAVADGALVKIQSDDLSVQTYQAQPQLLKRIRKTLL
jgi:hypothetical protein